MIKSLIYPKGLLCVLEGIDGSGKSSLLQHIAAALKNSLPIISTKEPGGTNLGKHLRTIIQDQQAPLILTFRCRPGSTFFRADYSES